VLYIDWHNKGKGKGHGIAGLRGQEEEWIYSCTLALTSALEGCVGGQLHAPATFSRGKPPYPLYRGLGKHQVWSGWTRKMSPPPLLDPRTVKPVASHYTDWAISVHIDWHGRSISIGTQWTQKYACRLLRFVEGGNNSQCVFVAFLDLSSKSSNIYLYAFYIEFKTNLPVICKRKYWNMQTCKLASYSMWLGYLVPCLREKVA